MVEGEGGGQVEGEDGVKWWRVVTIRLRWERAPARTSDAGDRHHTGV